jgi:CubicO group peptidase (beta-lactamase class C family)
MTSTTYTHARADEIGQTSQAFNANYRCIPYTYLDSNIPLTAGMGGVLTTAPDMLRWARLLLGGLSGTLDDGIVPSSVRGECMNAQVLVLKQWQTRFGHGRVTYGFGWWQDEVAGVRVSTCIFNQLCSDNPPARIS